MTKHNTSLAERLDGNQVAQTCSEQIINMTIGDYFGDHKSKLYELLALPTSKKWRLKPEDPLAQITLATDNEIHGTNELIKTTTRRAFDLILYPVVSSDYKLPFFSCTLRGFINYMDKVVTDKNALKCHNNMRKNWTGILDKSLNKTFKLFNEYENEDQKYEWFDAVFSNVFADLYALYETKLNY